MDYNWGDPRKNSRLKSIMMTKAEAGRKKRLNNVKSTVSNQLHPAAEKKLLKKKTPDTSRRHFDQDEQTDLDSELQDLIRMPRDNNVAHDSPDPAALSTQEPEGDVFSPLDMPFDHFGLNAAAEGLFHPASSIQAFKEHDEKYHPVVSSRISASASRELVGGEYPPSRENQKLPVLSAKAKREHLSSRSDSKVQTMRKSASTAHHNQDADAADRVISSTRSDSDLHAPRRIGLVPSSYDPCALDFYDCAEEDSDCCEVSPQPVARVNTCPPDLGSFSLLNKDDIIQSTSAAAAPVPALDLTTKFEALKQLMQKNAKVREKKGDEGMQRKSDDVERKAVAGRAGLEHARTTKTMSMKISETNKNTHSSRGSRAPTMTGSRSRVESNGSTPSPVNSQPAKEKASRVAVKKASVPIVQAAPVIRSKKDMAVRNGVSLTDLREEHRAALEMLQELGGPVDLNYQDIESDDKALSSTGKTYRLGLTASTGISIKTKPISKTNIAPAKVRAVPAATIKSTSATNGASLVDKLRASIPSGRERPKEASPAASPATMSPMPTARSVMSAESFGEEDSVEEKATLVTSNQSIEEPATSGGITELPNLDGKDLVAAALSAANQLLDQPAPTATVRLDVDEAAGVTDGVHRVHDEYWKQYEQENESEDEDDEDDEDDESARVSVPTARAPLSSSAFSGARVPTSARSDQYGDEEFENDC